MIGDIIKQTRKSKRLKQSELADMLSVSASTIGMYEQNRREPDIGTIVKLAKCLDVTLEYLLGVGDTPTEEERHVLDVAGYFYNEEKPADEGELEEEYSEQERALISAFRRADEEGKLRIIQISMNLADEAEKKSDTANKRNA